MDITQYASAFPGLSDEDFVAAGFSPDEVYAYRVNQQAASETSQAYDLAAIQEARRRRGEALAAQYPDYFTQGLEVEPSYGIDQRIADISAGAQLTQDPNFARRQFARLSTDLGLPLSLTESVLGLAELTPYGSFASGYDAASAIPQTAEYIRSGEYGKAALTAAGGGLAALDAAALALPISVPVARAVSNVDTGKLAADVVGTGRALADMDLEFLRGRGNPAMSQPAGADVTGRPPLTFDDVERAMRAAPKGAAVKPQMGEAFDDWIDRIYSPENRGPQNVVQDENVVFRAMSPGEAKAGEEVGVFRDLSGQPLYVANDPERYIGGGAYGGKRQGRIYEFDVTGLASEVRQGGVGIQERAISEIPTDRVRRIWEWNPNTKSHELIVDNTQVRAADDVPAPTGIKAYHGSPHDFDRFSMDKIGTGEGAQAYGHGLYFAENKGTAESYKQSVSRNIDELRNIAERDGGLSGDAAEMLSYQFSMNNFHGQGFDKWLDGIKDSLEKGWLNGRAKDAAEQIVAREVEASNAVRVMRSPGRLYEVNINANPEDFLDWDKPLREQPEGMVDKLRSAGLDVRDKSIRPPFYGLQSEASVAPLREAGIPGIRYLDAGSRGAGEGSRNYVVFDENLIDIVKKYGIAGAAALLGVSALDVEQAIAENVPQSEWDQLAVGQ